MYTGDALGDCHLMEEEVRDLHEAGLIESFIFQASLLAVRKRMTEIKENGNV